MQRSDEPVPDDPAERGWFPPWWPRFRGMAASGDPGLHPHLWQAQREAARRVSLSWGFAALFLGYAGYYLLHVVITAALPTGQRDHGPLLLLAFAPNVLLGLAPLVLSWRKGGGPRADFGIVPDKRDLQVGLFCGGAALLSSWLLGLLLISLLGPPPPSGLSGVQEAGKSVWLLLFAVFAFIGAPLTEELLVRGAFWGALEHYRVPRYAVLVLTALVFAFVHQEPWRLPILFSAGIAFGAARMITGRIGASMVAHATNNFFPALVLFFGAH